MMNAVMLVKNRPRLTKQALESFAENTDVSWTLTIVDDESGPETRAILKSFARLHSENVALLRNDTSSGITGQVRNLGVYWSEKFFGRGEWLYLSDNDVSFRDIWSAKLTYLSEMVGPQMPLIGGQNHPYHGPIGEIDRGQGWVAREYHALAGTSQLMRWETWDKYGPLEANAPGIGQSEDHAFCQRIRKDGFKVGAIWPPVVIDCSLTQTDGSPVIGIETKTERIPGIIYE